LEDFLRNSALAKMQNERVRFLLVCGLLWLLAGFLHDRKKMIKKLLFDVALWQGRAGSLVFMTENFRNAKQG
jgi:hypothetical protein